MTTNTSPYKNRLTALAHALHAKYPEKGFEMTKNAEDQYVVAFVQDGMSIYDPYANDCGRFEVDPVEVYGISLEHAELMVQANGLTKTNVNKPSFT